MQFATILALVATSLSLATTPNTQSDLEFSSSKLNIFDSQKGQSFQVRLRNRPTKASQLVHISGPGILLDRCSLNFTQSNFNQWQTVAIAGAPQFNDIKVESRIAFDVNGVPSYLPFFRNVTTANTCLSYGDPHVVIFDMVKGKDELLTQHTGLFHLFRHDDFNIQVNQQPCTPGSKVSCNHDAAIRFGDSVFHLVQDNSTKTFIVTSNFGSSKLHYTPRSKKDAAHRFRLPDGSVVEFAEITNKNFGMHLNIQLHLAVGWTNYGGLCNVGNNPKPNHLLFSDGTWAVRNRTNVPAFIKSWGVQQGESLFERGYKVNVPKATQLISCEEPITYTEAPLRPLDLSKIKREDVVEFVQDLKVNDTFLAKATSLCTMLFPTNTGCAQFIDIPAAVDNCVKDSILSKSFDFLDSHRENFMNVCHEKTKFQSLSPVETVRKDAEETKRQNGFGAFDCGGCNGRGECNEDGCACQSGFIGSHCETAVIKKCKKRVVIQ